MAYSTNPQVCRQIPNLLNNASSYVGIDATKHPNEAQLTGWQTAGCSIINARLSAAGYSVPIGSGATAYDIIAELEATYVAYRAELAHSSPRIATGERTRADGFRRAFEDGMKDLLTMDLTRMGVGYTGAWYVGGISEAEKDSVESDTDRVSNRFHRGQFENPERTEPTSSAS